MDDFCRSIRHARVREQLLSLIRGRGAFGRFNSVIRSLGLVQAWYQFHDEALEQIAIEWLEENQIPYERDSNRLKLSVLLTAKSENGATNERVNKEQSSTSSMSKNSLNGF
jgi:hypothetical protein